MEYGGVLVDVKNREVLGVDEVNHIVDLSEVKHIVDLNEVKHIVDLNEVKHNQTLDLNEEGDRWEGDVLNDSPWGWGVLYDKNNHRVYEGFRINKNNVCYGREYYNDIETVEYEGEFCDGMRWGRGVLYDRNGDVVFEGEWLNDDRLTTRITIASDDASFHNHIEELVVDANCCNGESWSVLDLSVMRSLKSVVVGDDCFKNVSELRMIGMREVESVVVGERSFTRRKNDFANNPERRVCVRDCPSLRQLRVGRHSFSDYTEMEIECVDALERIEMGELGSNSYNFYYASLELRSVCVFGE